MSEITAAKRPRRTIRRQPSEKRIADIMRAAREVFTEHGYSEALISDIAERAGVVEGSIYRFFRSKRDLLIRVAEAWFEEMLAEDDVQFAAIEGTRNRLRYIVFQHLVTIRTEPALSRIVLQELRTDPDYRSSRLYRLNQTYTHRVIALVRDCVASGEFRPETSPVLVRDMLYGCIEHRTWAFLRNEGEFDVVATADSIAGMIYRAVVAEPAPEEADIPDGLGLAIARLEGVTSRLEQLAR